MTAVQILAIISSGIGAFFMLMAAVGIVRMPDLYTRLHCSTKSATLGVGFQILAAILYAGDPAVALRGIAVVVFMILTAPVAGHIIARSVYRAKRPGTQPPATD
jgi:multicomponent Na+:H+ antiporter subunit G